MSELALNHLCVHYVDRKGGKLELSSSEQDISRLDPFVCEFLLHLVRKVWEAEDRGATISARFANSGQAPQLAKNQIERIAGDETQVYAASKALASHLFDRSAPNASPGLLAVLHLRQAQSGQVYVAILKIEVNNQKFVRLSPTTLTRLSVEDVENMLLKDIQKGAIYPHPKKKTYDLKVVENQSDAPARYFSDGFLGCQVKKSDEHQVTKLIKALEGYARSAGLPFARERTPELILALQEQRENVTTGRLSRVVDAQGLYGPYFKKNDFIDFIDRGRDPGPIDIPYDHFVRRGKDGAGKPREMKLEFTDPQLRALRISGPAHILDEIMQVEGDSVTFSIRTTREGFRITYD